MDATQETKNDATQTRAWFPTGLGGQPGGIPEWLRHFHLFAQAGAPAGLAMAAAFVSTAASLDDEADATEETKNDATQTRAWFPTGLGGQPDGIPEWLRHFHLFAQTGAPAGMAMAAAFVSTAASLDEEETKEAKKSTKNDAMCWGL